MVSNASQSLSKVDQEIYDCLIPSQYRSFFLFAGAGSGKTRSLVTALQTLRDEHAEYFIKRGQNVAIITYTNAAADEIRSRLEYHPIFTISTIHSFAWELIQHYQRDIKHWVIKELEKSIEKLTSKKRLTEKQQRELDRKQFRFNSLASINKFSYDPNSTNSSRDSLNHAEVIKMAAAFLMDFPLMQRILNQRYPILLVDESQDTKRELMEAFFLLDKQQGGNFCLGLFGDTMQRIYMDGKPDLGQNLPKAWAKPAKTVNYRCPIRVIALINAIRGNQPQKPGPNNEEGIVRLFIAPNDDSLDKDEFELSVGQRMAVVTQDEAWQDPKQVKTLTLEHHMAARRDGWLDFYEALKGLDQTGLLDGKLTGIPVLVNGLLPLVEAVRQNQATLVMRIVEKQSPLFHDPEAPVSLDTLETLRQGVQQLTEFLEKSPNPILQELAQLLHQTQLLPIPYFMLSSEAPTVETEDNTEEEDEDEETKLNRDEAWASALQSSLSALKAYTDYIHEHSRFGTHQGVKGLEFPRVQVILDDTEARGNQFSYEKIFGAKNLSKTDQKNIEEGKESTIDRTKRLLYVACSRAKESLAVVMYTQDPEKVRKHAVHSGWFEEGEIYL